MDLEPTDEEAKKLITDGLLEIVYLAAGTRLEPLAIAKSILTKTHLEYKSYQTHPLSSPIQNAETNGIFE